MIADPTRRAEFRAYLNGLIGSAVFSSSRRRGELLRYLVECTLTGKADTITEYAIGLDVYGKPASFDPRIDSSVRSDMSRLRRTLIEYYERQGAGDRWRIEFPNRGYVPVITSAPARSDEPEAETPVPTDQPVTAEAARRSSRWSWVVAAAIGIVICIFAAWTAIPARRPFRAVVVLPFENMTGDPNSGYLADGITEQLTDALAQTPSLRVVARTSAFQFKDKGVDVRSVGRQLDVDVVVEGSLRKIDNGYRLTVQVNRTADGYHILSKTFDGRTSELARLEKDMVIPVLAALRPGVAAAQRRIPDPEAYDLYLKASSYHGQVTPESYEKAISNLSQAIEHDPKYADAYAALAEVYVSLAVNASVHPLEPVPLAKAAAQKALQLDPLSAPAYAAEGFADATILLDWKRGEEALRNAIRLAPGRAKCHNWLGSVLMAEGRFPEALAELRTGDSMDPLNPAPTVARALYMARQYDESLEECAKMLRLHPDQHMIHLMIGKAWEAKGDYTQALAEYGIFDAKIPGTTLYKYCLAHLYAVAGRTQEARQLLFPLEHPAPGTGKPSPWDIALTYTALRDLDQAFLWLGRAYDDRNIWFLKVDPALDPLRGDARYGELLQKAGLS